MNAPQNVAAHLPAMAQKQPHQPAVINPHGRDRWGRAAYVHYTFAQLDEACDFFAKALAEAGLGRGMRAALMVPPGLEFFALTFALFKIAAVPVLIDPGMGIRNLGKCLAEAQPEAFIGIPKAHLARRVLGWARRSIDLTVAVGRPGLGCDLVLDRLPRSIRAEFAATEPFPVAEVAAEEMAAILFTSGSTGIAKGAVYTHGIFASQVEAIRDAFTIQPGEVDLCTFPLFALFAPALGMTSIVPDMDATRPAKVDPEKIFEAVKSFGVTNLFGSPALLNRVGRGAGEKQSMPTLRRVVSAGAPVPTSVIERFARMLSPGVEVFTPYGATEALPVAVIGSNEILSETRAKTDEGAGICVGRPVAGIDVRIIPIRDEPIPLWSDDLPLPAGQIGEIAVHGPWVTASYFNRPEATALAKIEVPGGGFYHRMGDVGYFDDRARLWFCGRKSHRVVTKLETHFTIPCEAVFNTHPDVFRTALVGVNRLGKVEPVLCVEREPHRPPKSEDALRKELLAIAAKHPHTQSIRTILFHPAFPVDIRHNSKIFREKLAIWAQRRLR
ncbi:MAG TPA: fatty acid CoA ligase family protein [Gemmataceae bacterium]|nr:fatty acid CoA ligase family protein [Gemmataceae bacterium]